MNKETNYVCCRVQENTESNLRKVLELLSEITRDECHFNYKLSDATQEMRLEIHFILLEVYKETRK